MGRGGSDFAISRFAAARRRPATEAGTRWRGCGPLAGGAQGHADGGAVAAIRRFWAADSSRCGRGRDRCCSEFRADGGSPRHAERRIRSSATVDGFVADCPGHRPGRAIEGRGTIGQRYPALVATSDGRCIASSTRRRQQAPRWGRADRINPADAAASGSARRRGARWNDPRELSRGAVVTKVRRTSSAPRRLLRNADQPTRRGVVHVPEASLRRGSEAARLVGSTRSWRYERWTGPLPPIARPISGRRPAGRGRLQVLAGRAPDRKILSDSAPFDQRRFHRARAQRLEGSNMDRKRLECRVRYLGEGKAVRAIAGTRLPGMPSAPLLRSSYRRVRHADALPGSRASV